MIPWPYSNNNISPPLDQAEDYVFSMDSNINHHGFSSPFTTLDDFPDVDFSIPYLATTLSHDDLDFPGPIDGLDTTFSAIDLSQNLEKFDPIFRSGINNMSQSLEENEVIFHTHGSTLDEDNDLAFNQSMDASDIPMDMTPIQQSLALPTENMAMGNLVMALGEAMDKGQAELAEAITKRMSDKCSPVGEIVERLLYYLFQRLDKESEYLKHESFKNFYAAFKAFYQIFPYGKFAHFAANLAILEAMPHDAEIIHIFDFDMAEGIQWSSMIEALGRQGRELRLLPIKWGSGDTCSNSSPWRFEETKRRLYNHATSFGLKLKVEEMELQNLMSEMKKMNKRGKREWFAFNCMVSLPHMGRVKSRRDVMKFLMVANDFLTEYCCNNANKIGIVTLGDGDILEKLKNFSTSFGSFLDGYLVHYQALLESIESHFPIHFGEARTAMECLFVAPFVSSLALFKKWEEIKESFDHVQSKLGFEGWQVSQESLMEAKEMVREGETLYGVRIEGVTNNEIVLEWRGIPLVKVSCWRNLKKQNHHRN